MSSDTPLKERIRRGDIVIGVSVPMDTPKSQVEDILSKDDYGFITCDSQHSPFSEHRLVEYCNMADELGIPVHFRIKHTQFAFLVGNIADLGPAIIEIPLVEEVATVREALEWFYFPPEGRRSWVGGYRWGAELGHDRLGYAKWWNDNGILMLQVETLRAIENIRTLALPGVDLFSWGPADLEFDREMHPHHPLKTDADCIKHVMDQVNDLDVRMSYRSGSPDLRNKYIDLGVTVLMEAAR
jgi:2-keto-3-deoxy-L-rhamnonate aldolase RhmA